MPGMPKRTLDSFATRVQMGTRFRLFMVVEGPDVDPVFYSELLNAMPDPVARASRVVPIDEIGSRGEVSPAGGRISALAAFEHWRSRGLLVQQNSNGRNAIMVAVDNDLEIDEPALLAEPHLLPTVARDVEGEIISNCDLAAAFRRLAFVDHPTAEPLAEAAREFIGRVAENWKLWVLIGMISRFAASGGEVSWCGSSLINTRDDPPDTGKTNTMIAKLRALFKPSEFDALAFHTAGRFVERTAERGSWSVLKGKWLVPLLIQWLVTERPELASKKSELKASCLRTLLAAMDFSAGWTRPYVVRVQAVTALC